jgi:hypothetical protein
MSAIGTRGNPLVWFEMGLRPVHKVPYRCERYNGNSDVSLIRSIGISVLTL